jgi:putative transposase
MSRPKASKRFTGLKLSKADRRALLEMQARGRKMTARTWRRIRTLLLLHEGQSASATARAVGGFKREALRVGKRYLAGGLQAALSDDPRPTRGKSMDSTQEAAVVALACGPAPEGAARWTTRLLAQEAVRRGIVDKVGREKIRVVLASHGTKPWREKNVVRAENRSGVRE